MLNILRLGLNIFLLGLIFFPLSTFSANEASAATNAVVQDKVRVLGQSEDKAIKKRLFNILKATGWFAEINVRVEDGVVFIQGKAKSEKHKTWAYQAATKIQDVVAVVNQIELVDDTSWHMEQVLAGLKAQWKSILRSLPFWGLSLLVLLLTWGAAKVVAHYTRLSLSYRKFHPLLSDLIGKLVALFCFLLGLYIVLQLLGLTTIALTILGGTGLIGIILGIAFRDITENLLASIFLSVQKPFKNDDLIEVTGITGYVQGLTIRATILMTLDGHEVQLPNAMVYKNAILNFTSNPNWRESFVVGIGYNESIANAQSIALAVLHKHRAVLSEPEPAILVEELAVSTINLRIFFWIDGREYNWRKVRSSVIRLIKSAFQQANISMPAQVIELNMVEGLDKDMAKEKQVQPIEDKSKRHNKQDLAMITSAEGALKSEAKDIQTQAKNIKDKQQNLLEK